jgi:hypothetical protein
VKTNVALLYGFSFFDQFMIVIALWIPYLTTQVFSIAFVGLLLPLAVRETALTTKEASS